MIWSMWFVFLFSALGAINWGLVVFFDMNVIDRFFEHFKSVLLVQCVYGVISLSGLCSLIALFWLYLK